MDDAMRAVPKGRPESPAGLTVYFPETIYRVIRLFLCTRLVS